MQDYYFYIFALVVIVVAFVLLEESGELPAEVGDYAGHYWCAGVHLFYVLHAVVSSS